MSSPRIERFSLVGSLSRKTLQAKMLILMGIYLTHRVGTTAFERNKPSMKSLADFTEKISAESKLQVHRSLELGSITDGNASYLIIVQS
ncbi:hypothetical protein Tco_0292845 [Tanacetum coccineum]